MKYFNGFSLRGEEELFTSYLDKSEFTVAGFSYGAQKAFEAVYHSNERVEKLILLSPAFFQSEKKSFVRTQLRYFDSDRTGYVQQFLKNVTYPGTLDMTAYLNTGTKEELDALLTYHWDSERINEVLEKGTRIEVYLGGKDKIIQSDEAFAFFSKLTITYLIKEAGHSLQR
ncbi:MAG: pimelyl-ACP methyl ester esterase BioV [Campylobacterota bacterium]|nr:pimelyl-ACP methyl ester esterase BioV [Campylobacterota bacterium]